MKPAHSKQSPWTHTSATSCQLLLDGEAEWRLRLRMVRTAKSFLYLSTFYYELDQYGETMFRELESARERGVDVTLIIDAFGQRLAAALMPLGVRREMRSRLRELRAAGIRLIFYRPPKLLQRVLGSGYHIKIQVSDRGEAIFGSGNISRMSFERWMEFAAVLRGAVTVALLAELLKLCDPDDFASSAHLRQLARTVDSTGDGRHQLDYLSYNPCEDPSRLSPIRQRHDNPITQQLLQTIDKARENIFITSLYAKPAPVLFDALEKAARRGVCVEIHHSQMDALREARVAWLVASLGYQRLLRAGVRIYEHAGGQHTKFVLIDEKEAWFGSYNFEHAADDRLAEAMLVTRDGDLVEMVRRFFEGLRNDPKNERVAEEAISQLPRRLKAYRRLCAPFRRWLQ